MNKSIDAPTTQQLRMYFNTTGLEGKDLHAAKERVKGQNLRILSHFRSRPGIFMTPFDVLNQTGIQAPITSIRRAINTLTRLGYLEKTDYMKEGEYGTMNHTWVLSTDHRRIG